MVKPIKLLSDFSNERNALVNLLDKKIKKLKTSSINEYFDPKLKVELKTITDLITSIETKFKKCEILYFTYFENIDHAVLSGNVSTLPLERDCTYKDGTSSLKYYFKVDDRILYKEVVDLNFQNFILLISSLFENIVNLIEICTKKVIVHLKNKQPLSYPLHDYLGYLNFLLSLGYRQNDTLQRCLSSLNPFFEKYLKQINILRNKFIHGYSVNLVSDGSYYFVQRLDEKAFTSNSPDLIVDVFTFEIMINTNQFIKTLLIALKKSTDHSKKVIPV